LIIELARYGLPRTLCDGKMPGRFATTASIALTSKYDFYIRKSLPVNGAATYFRGNIYVTFDAAAVKDSCRRSITGARIETQ